MSKRIGRRFEMVALAVLAFAGMQFLPGISNQHGSAEAQQSPSSGPRVSGSQPATSGPSTRPSYGTTCPYLKEAFLKVQKPTKPFTDFAPTPTGTANAADSYYAATQLLPEGNMDAMNDYINQTDKAVRGWLKTPPAADDKTLVMMQKMADLVAAGAQNAKMEYFGVHTPKELKVAWVLPSVNRIYNVGEMMQTLAMYNMSQKDYKAAEKVMQDTFTMGRQCQEERVSTWMSFNVGVELQIRCLEILREINSQMAQADPSLKEKSAGKVSAIDDYMTELRSIQWDLGVKTTLLQMVTPKPADVFTIAKYDEDRAWRVHAILTLGRLRFTSDKPADVKQANALIEEFMKSSDPWEAAAAKAAQVMTAEENKKYGMKD